MIALEGQSQSHDIWKCFCCSFVFTILFLVLWWFGWMPGAHQSCSITPLFDWRGEKKFNERLTAEVKAGRDHSPITVMGKTNSAWEISWNLLPIKSE